MNALNIWSNMPTLKNSNWATYWHRLDAHGPFSVLWGCGVDRFTEEHDISIITLITFTRAAPGSCIRPYIAADVSPTVSPPLGSLIPHTSPALSATTKLSLIFQLSISVWGPGLVGRSGLVPSDLPSLLFNSAPAPNEPRWREGGTWGLRNT